MILEVEDETSLTSDSNGTLDKLECLWFKHCPFAYFAGARHNYLFLAQLGMGANKEIQSVMKKLGVPNYLHYLLTLVIYTDFILAIIGT